MKKLLVLLLSFGFFIPLSVEAEIVLYCQSELATGFIKKNGSWEQTKFKSDRFTIKFNNDYSRLEGMTYIPMECKAPYKLLDQPELIYCVDSENSHSTLRYNKKTKRFVHYFQPYIGYIGNGTDTDVLYAGTCKAF